MWHCEFSAYGIAGFTIAFIYGWKMTLVTLAAIPLMGAAGYFQVTPRNMLHPVPITLAASSCRGGPTSFEFVAETSASWQAAWFPRVHDPLCTSPLVHMQHTLKPGQTCHKADCLCHVSITRTTCHLIPRDMSHLQLFEADRDGISP